MKRALITGSLIRMGRTWSSSSSPKGTRCTGAVGLEPTTLGRLLRASGMVSLN